MNTGRPRRCRPVFAPAPARSDVPSGSGRGGRRRDGPDSGSTLVDALVALSLCGIMVPPTLAVASTMVSASHRTGTRLALEAVARDAALRVLVEDACADPVGVANLATEAATAIGWPTATVSIGALAAPVLGDDGIWRWIDAHRACTRPAQMAQIIVRSPDGAATTIRHVVVTALPDPS